MPILYMRSTSPHLEVGMCDNGSVAIRLLLIGGGRFATVFCLGGLAINGDFLLHCTSSMNLARRRAASCGVGVVILDVEAHPSRREPWQLLHQR